MNKKVQDWYFISAGEYSGDLLAANFVLSFKEINPSLSAFGITGDAMRAAHVKPVLDMNKLSVMGIADVACRLGELRILEKQVLQRIDEHRPKFAVLVDFPGLHFRLAEQLRLRNIPVIQYVAPKVWAWRQKRVKNLRRDFDLVLGVLPFEEAFFKDAGVNYKFIGSPHKDRTSKVIVHRSSFGMAEDAKIVGLLPGSRKSELAHILPKLIKIKEGIQKQFPQTRFIMPLASNLSAADLESVLPGPHKVSEINGKLHFAGIEVVRGMSLEIMAVSDLVLVASGTATLECALVGTPMVVVYVMDQASFDIAQRAVKIPYISLVNLIAGRELVKEYVQTFKINDVVQTAVSLFEPTVRADMIDAFNAMRDDLPGNASFAAAMTLNKYLQERGLVPD